MRYNKNKINSFATSPEFLAWLTEALEGDFNESGIGKYQYEEFKHTLDEFKNMFNALTYSSNNTTYTGAEAIWYQDKNKVVRFVIKFVDKKLIGSQFSLIRFYSIHKLYSCENVLKGEDIYKRIPMTPGSMLCWPHPHSNDTYIYYETKTDVFNLDLWSLLEPFALAHNSQNNWRSVSITAKLIEDVIEFYGFARRDYRRFYYEDFTYEARFNIINGELVLHKAEFVSDTYK